MEFEAKIIQFIQAGVSQEWTVFFRIVSLLGSWVGFLLVFFIFLFFFSKRYAVVFGITYGLAVGCNYLFKLFVSRGRPYMTYEGIQALTDAMGSSFPSGHAVSSIIIAFFVIVLVFKMSKNKFTKYGTLFTMIMYVGLICLSRTYLGVHYLTDLVAGLCLGMLFCLFCYMIYRKVRVILEERKKVDKWRE